MKLKKLILITGIIFTLFLCFGISVNAAKIVEEGECGSYLDNVNYVLYDDGTLEISGKGEIFISAFSENQDIKHVIINDGIEGIEVAAFENCKNLKTIYIPNSVSEIGLSSFEGCSSLQGIVLSNSYKASFGWAPMFTGCTSLEYIYLPDSVEIFGDSFIEGCNNLKTIFYEGTEKQWQQIIKNTQERSYDNSVNLVKQKNIICNVSKAKKEALQNGTYEEGMASLVTIYAPDGSTKNVPSLDVDTYISTGKWKKHPYVRLYTLDGREQVFENSEVAAQLTVGWYKEPSQILYTKDGRSQVFPKKDVPAQLTVGWYTIPYIKMYSTDGRTITVPQSEVEAHKNVGWYDNEYTTLYTIDRRTQQFKTTEVDAQCTVGWYRQPQQKLDTPKSIENYLNKYYPVMNTAVGSFKLNYSVYELGNVISVWIKYPIGMIGDMSYNTDYSVDSRILAKAQTKRFMYTLANAVMAGNYTPIEIEFYEGGYKYPTLQVGYSSISFCSCKNYKTNYINGMRTIDIVGFYWDETIDEYDFKYIKDF